MFSELMATGAQLETYWMAQLEVMCSHFLLGRTQARVVLKMTGVMGVPESATASSFRANEHK